MTEISSNNQFEELVQATLQDNSESAKAKISFRITTLLKKKRCLLNPTQR